jgi:His-Xaa-Ser system protein HxsD
MKIYKEIDDGFEIILYKEIYEREAVLSIAYKFNDNFYMSIEPYEDNKVKVTVTEGKDRIPPTENDIKNILSELKDEQFRLDILKRTFNIRERIYEKAFSPLKEYKK